MALTPPTGARTILFGDAPAILRGRRFNPPAPSFPAKDPTEDLTYGMDFRRVIEGSQTIVSAPVVALPPGTVSILQTQVYGSLVVFRAFGGVDGVQADIVATVTLSDGQMIRRVARLPIRRLADVPCPPVPPCPPDPPCPDPCKPRCPNLSVLEEIYMADCERQPVRILSGGGELADYSVNPVAITGTLLATLPRNLNRAYAEVQNQAVTPIQIQIDDGVGEGTGKNAPIIALSAAPTVGGQGGGWSTTVVKGRIRIFGTTGSSVTLYEE